MFACFHGVATGASSRGMHRLPACRRNTEEPWSRPVGTGDLTGNLGQRAITLTLIFEAIIKHEHTMRLPTPVAHKTRARFQRWCKAEGAVGALSVDLPRQVAQHLLGGLRETAVGVFLHLVGDRTQQQIAAHPCRRLAAEVSPPFDPKAVAW